MMESEQTWYRRNPVLSATRTPSGCGSMDWTGLSGTHCAAAGETAPARKTIKAMYFSGLRNEREKHIGALLEAVLERMASKAARKNALYLKSFLSMNISLI